MADYNESVDEKSVPDEEASGVSRLKARIGKTASLTRKKTVDRGGAVVSAASGGILLKSFDTALRGSDLIAQQ